jgi:CheY-like chemotaxis protein
MLERNLKEVTVKLASNGFDAGILVGSFHPGVIFLDLMMPGMNGFEVCRTIKSDPDNRDIRIIAMTGYYTDENKNRIVAEGAETCLAKPVDTDTVLRLVRDEESVSAG